MMRQRQARSGFTLIELLVVTGMLAAFLGLILVGMRSTGGSQGRQFGQSLGGSFVAVQSKALASEVGTALILVPGVNGMFASACNTVYRADVPPFIAGTCTGVPPTNLVATSTTAALTPENTGAAALSDGYRIRFRATPNAAPSAWMKFSPPNTVAFSGAMSQTRDNTIWPINGSYFEMARKPTKSTLDFAPTPKAGIDLRFSGIGDDPAATYGVFGSGGAEITLSFNRQGGLDSVIQGAGDAISPTAPLYLLIASASDIENGTSLASEDSRWLVISPSTGRQNVSPNIPTFGDATLQNLQSARALARQGAVGGGR